MKCLIENQLPKALAEYLITKGHEAQHVLDIDLAEAKDQDILRREIFAGNCDQG